MNNIFFVEFIPVQYIILKIDKHTRIPSHTINLYCVEGTNKICCGWPYICTNSYYGKCRSQWPCGLRRRSAAARLLRSWLRIPPAAWMFVCCVCCVLSGRGLCDELITRPEESYRLCYVVVFDLETSRMRRLWPALGRSEKKNTIHWEECGQKLFNPLKPELNPICYLLALLGAHHFLHVSRIRVKLLTFRRLMSYIYGASILDVSRSHTTTQHSR